MCAPLARSAAIVVALAVLSAPAISQSNEEMAGYFATLVTPAGALPGWVTPAMADARHDGVGLRAAYGHVRLQPSPTIDANSVGGSLDLMLLRGRVSLSGTGGYLIPSCPDGGGVFPVGVNCKGFAMVGGELTARLFSYYVHTDGRGTLTVALAARGGKAFVENSTVYSLSAALPISIAVDAGNTTLFVPFISPGATRGHLQTSMAVPIPDSLGVMAGGVDATGTRFVLSGGLALLGTRSGLGLHVSATRIFIKGGRTQFGVALSWNSLRARGTSRRGTYMY